MTIVIQTLVIPIASLAVSMHIVAYDNDTITVGYDPELEVTFVCDNSVFITCFVICVISALLYNGRAGLLQC